MKKLLVLFAFVVSSFAAYCGVWDEVVLSGATDKPPCSYRSGQKIMFDFSLTGLPEGAPLEGYQLKWHRRGDDGAQSEGFLPLARSGMRVETSLSSPGFVHMEAWVVDASGSKVKRDVRAKRSCTGPDEVRFTGGAGVDIERIKPGAPEPADFSSRWRSALARLRREKPVSPDKLKSFMTDVSDGCDFIRYEVAVPSFGPGWTDCFATGHLTMPKNASAKSLKAKVEFDGYGVYRQGRPPWCDRDSITLHVNAHGLYPLEMTDAQFEEFKRERIENRGGYAFNDEDNSEFEKAYFFGMAMRAVSATTFLREFVQTRPEWDGSTIISTGGSQGGLQATWAAALAKGVTELRVHVPWCCDLAGTDVGRMGGWRPALKPGLAYFDTVNMAHHVPEGVTKVIFRSALGDYIAPPSTHAVMYNVMRGRKELRYVQGGDHYDDPPEPLQVDVKTCGTARAQGRKKK